MLPSKFTIQQQQFLNLMFLFVVGMLTQNIYLSWYQVGAILLFTLFFVWWMDCMEYGIDVWVPYSALTTSLGVMLMMITPHLWLYGLIILMGLIQKKMFRYERRHFFNPSNFALMGALLFFYHDTHIVLGQLGDEFWLGLTVTLLGFWILYRANRWMIPVVFVSVFITSQYLYIVRTDPVMTMYEVMAHMGSVSFIVFVLFMLTDPRTTPSTIPVQIYFATMVALGVTLLDYLNGVRVQHLFMALFASSSFVPLMESIWHKDIKKSIWLKSSVVLFMAISVIIIVEMRSPYYFAMEG